MQDQSDRAGWRVPSWGAGARGACSRMPQNSASIVSKVFSAVEETTVGLGQNLSNLVDVVVPEGGTCTAEVNDNSRQHDYEEADERPDTGRLSGRGTNLLPIALEPHNTVCANCGAALLCCLHLIVITHHHTVLAPTWPCCQAPSLRRTVWTSSSSSCAASAPQLSKFNQRWCVKHDGMTSSCAQRKRLGPDHVGH